MASQTLLSPAKTNSSVEFLHSLIGHFNINDKTFTATSPKLCAPYSSAFWVVFLKAETLQSLFLLPNKRAGCVTVWCSQLWSKDLWVSKLWPWAISIMAVFLESVLELQKHPPHQQVQTEQACNTQNKPREQGQGLNKQTAHFNYCQHNLLGQPGLWDTFHFLSKQFCSLKYSFHTPFLLI